MRPTRENAWNMADEAAKVQQGLASTAQTAKNSEEMAGDQVAQLALVVAYVVIFCLTFLLLYGRRQSYNVEKVKRRLGTEHVLPLKNLREMWITVAVDGVLALMCGIPGFGLFALVSLFYRYSFSYLHLFVDTPDVDPEDAAVPPEKPRWMALQQVLIRLLAESVLWTNLAIRCCVDVKVYHGHFRDVALADNMDEEAKNKFRIISFDIFAATCATASTLLWRSLFVNSIRIKAHVMHHRQIAWREMTQRGKAIWKRLDACGFVDFVDFEKNEFKENSLRKERRLIQTDWSYGWRDVLLVSTSSLVMCGGMLNLQLKRFVIDWSDLRKFTPWLRLLIITVSTYQATFFWVKFTWGVLRMTSRFKGRANRLLLLSAISKPYRSENWSEDDIEALDSLLKNAKDNLLKKAKETGNTMDEKGIGIQIGAVEGHELVRRVDVTDSSVKLDLSMHLRDWWKCRQFLQIDAVDGAAGVEFCSVVVAFLLCNYAVVGLTSWFAEKQVRKVGFLMILLLSAFLIRIMWLILQTCVGTNTLLDMDAELLCAASQRVLEPEDEASQEPTDAHGDPKPKDEVTEASQKPLALHSDVAASKHAILLHSREREASAAYGKQQLFGVTVTSNLMNGWIFSLVLAFATSAWQVLGDMITNHMDVLKVITDEAKRRHMV